MFWSPGLNYKSVCQLFSAFWVLGFGNEYSENRPFFGIFPRIGRSKTYPLSIHILRVAAICADEFTNLANNSEMNAKQGLTLRRTRNPLQAFSNLSRQGTSGLKRGFGPRNGTVVACTASCGIGLGVVCFVFIYSWVVLSIMFVDDDTSRTTSALSPQQDETPKLIEPSAILVSDALVGVDTTTTTVTSSKTTSSFRKQVPTTLKKIKAQTDQNKDDLPFKTSHMITSNEEHVVHPDFFLHVQNKAATYMAKDDAIPIDRLLTPKYILTAYQEPLNLEEWDIKPLPVRSKANREILTKTAYPQLNSCSRLPEQWPVDDTPADKDPFLPWIHDVFPTSDGKYIQFVAQNKRRCDTGKHDTEILKFRQPQAALFQHVPLKRVRRGSKSNNHHEYRLSTHDEADEDAVATRFICRFKPSMEETLSVFNFDYDWTTFRKRYKGTFHTDDGGIK